MKCLVATAGDERKITWFVVLLLIIASSQVTLSQVTLSAKRDVRYRKIINIILALSFLTISKFVANIKPNCRTIQCYLTQKLGRMVADDKITSHVVSMHSAMNLKGVERISSHPFKENQSQDI